MDAEGGYSNLAQFTSPRAVMTSSSPQRDVDQRAWGRVALPTMILHRQSLCLSATCKCSLGRFNQEGWSECLLNFIKQHNNSLCFLLYRHSGNEYKCIISIASRSSPFPISHVRDIIQLRIDLLSLVLPLRPLGHQAARYGAHLRIVRLTWTPPFS